MYSVRRLIVIAMTSEQEKLKGLVKYCYAYHKSGRINRCAKLIGRCLNECEGTSQDVRVAKLLLGILVGDNSDR